MKKHERIPHITRILNVEPFKVTCVWDTGEVQVKDFEDDIARWKSTNYELLLPLSDYENFRHVSVNDTGTLQWENIPVTFTFDGQTHTEPLDLDPIVLYQTSKPLSAYRLVPVEEAA